MLFTSDFNSQSGHGLALTSRTAVPRLRHTASMTSGSFPYLFLAPLRMLITCEGREGLGVQLSCTSSDYLRPPRLQPLSGTHPQDSPALVGRISWLSWQETTGHGHCESGHGLLLTHEAFTCLGVLLGKIWLPALFRRNT